MKVLQICFHIDGFTLCKANSDVLMRHNGDTYEYVAVYEDDFLCTMKDPKSFLDHLIQVHKYKLKADKPLSFHLGCDLGCDSDGTCYYQPKNYILLSKMLSTYEHMFPGETLQKQSSQTYRRPLRVR